MPSLPELNHKQGMFNEYVYVCNMHVATYLGAMTLLIVVIIALSGCIFGSFCKLKVKLLQEDESSGKGRLIPGLLHWCTDAQKWLKKECCQS